MRRLLFPVLMCLLTSLCGWAQAIQTPHKVKALGDREAGDSLDLYAILNGNAPADFPGSGVPSAVVVGRGGKFVLGAGGFVKALAGWDIGHPISSPDEFITSQIPMTPMNGDESRFNLSARQSFLYLNFVLFPASVDGIGAFVGMNFLDEGYMPVLQYAYLRYRGLKAGYDTSLFSDAACGAPAVDYEGPCSNTSNPVGGISYSHSFGAMEAGGGIELPQTSFTTVEGKTKYVYQRVPDIPLFARYSWGGGSSWVRLSAILRSLTYRNETEERNHTKLGYGFQLSGAENFLDRFTFYWQGVWGKGIGSMIQDTVDEGLDLTPSDGGTSLSPVMLWGGFLALNCRISSKVMASVTYSQLRTYARRYEGGTTPWADLYKYAQYATGNLFYAPVRHFELGIEYIWGRRTNYSGLKCADNRVQASVQFTF